MQPTIAEIQTHPRQRKLLGKKPKAADLMPAKYVINLTNNQKLYCILFPVFDTCELKKSDNPYKYWGYRIIPCI